MASGGGISLKGFKSSKEVQQFTYGVVAENSAENSRKFAKKCVLLHQERVRKFCGKFAEISRKSAENFLE